MIEEKKKQAVQKPLALMGEIPANPPDVPYIVHESDMARMERVNRRLWLVVIGLIVLLVATNVGWLLYESQFEDQVITQEVSQETSGEGDNVNNFVYGDYNGKTDSENDSNAQSAQNGR